MNYEAGLIARLKSEIVAAIADPPLACLVDIEPTST